MSDPTKRTESDRDAPEISLEALADLPLFPLPGAVLLPHTLLSLHVFEPRYVKMIEDLSGGYRALAVAFLDEDGPPDRFGRPPVHSVAGVGVLRRAAKLPDGRFNVVLEGVLRADIRDELAPELAPLLPYRRARAKELPDVLPEDPRELSAAIASVRALAARVVAQMASADGEIMKKLNEVERPGLLADMIAAAAIQDNLDRQMILAEPHIVRRLNLASAGLASLLLRVSDKQSAPPPFGWGIGPGKA